MTSQSEVGGWAVGWTAFAGMMMILMGFCGPSSDSAR